MSTEGVNEAQMWVARKVSYWASAALAVMIMDYALTFCDEIRCIWPKIRTSSYARTYMLARFNVYFSMRMASGTYTAPPLCKSWYSYQAVSIQIMMAVVDVLLMRRVYALFSGSYWILAILIALAAAQPSSMVASAVTSVPGVKYTQTCLIIRTHHSPIYFGATTLATHIVILLLTFWKFFLASGSQRSSLPSIIMRDTTISVMAICVILLFMMLCVLGVIDTTMSGNVTFYWLFCTLWISVGRIILNVQKLRLDEHSADRAQNSRGGFTTHITVLDDVYEPDLHDEITESVSNESRSALAASLDESQKDIGI
ncbi:hypothetical protein BV22DRAFT_1132475 [Leucogyrophana mollusca]|uniref:Uncharacterized protein n=1 Tax=Leucogyrophana mollusca TaxID=85980 RepID=A0ACB8B6A3_9AGAM|nr:hypothetical protein BV22DRAFT_1132475 [Leucogyrophana mollusca]